MFIRYSASAVILLASFAGLNAQQQPKKDRPISSSTPTKNVPQFISLFKPVVEKASKSTLRVLVDGKDASLATVVSADGLLLTKASEIKSGPVTVKLRNGKEAEAKVVSTSDYFDLALLSVQSSDLSPVEWYPSDTAPVGNWVAVVGTGTDPAAVGVVSVAARSAQGALGSPRIPTAQSGFLGVRLSQEDTAATIAAIEPGSAAEKAGIKPKDLILAIDRHEILDSETLMATLLTYKAGETVKVTLEREGKKMELTAKLGSRPPELIPKGKGGRGDMQNSMGSSLSERRTGIPIFFQTDAVVKPTDCGAPLVDLDGKVLGVTIARAGRTESYVIPSEIVQQLLPILMATRDVKTRSERTAALKAALAKVIENKVAASILAEAKKVAIAAEEDEKWWKERLIESGPAPRVVEK